MTTKKKQNNDQVIFQLKKEVETKKSELAKIAKFTPITNCMLTLDSIRYNLNVCGLDDLQFLVVRLSLYKERNSTLFFDKPLIISSHNIDHWLEDLKNRYNYLNIKTEQDKLKKLEDKLYDLLSKDSKDSIELEAIRKSLL
jgi:hypothetical protein